MIRPAALLLIGCTALAACKPEAPAAPTQLANEATVEARADTLRGWDRLFGSPQTTIPAANQYGFHADPYAATPGGAAAKGTEILMSNSAAKAPNKASFTATGKDAATIDNIVFALAITDPAQARVAKQRFADVIGNFVFSAKADGAKPVQDAIAAEKPAEGTVNGAHWAITAQPIAGAKDNRLITVTFIRPGTKPATSSS